MFMNIIGIILMTFVVLLWVGIFGAVAIGSLREHGRRRMFGVAGGLLVVFGFLSFAAPFAAAWVPSDIEWPVGWAGTVITLPSGMHVVSHDPSERVQVYDANWHFLHGWYVDCAGGIFVSTKALPDGTIEVVTARTHMRYVFDVQGQTLVKEPAPPKVPAGSSHISFGEYVPTWPWLFPLTTPFLAFLTMILGMVTLAIGGHVRVNKLHR
jgi:hypothetical protein